MLKILIVSVGKLSGGVESYTLTLGKLLENKGYEVHYVLRANSWLDTKINTDKKLRVYMGRHIISDMIALKKYVNECNISIVHCNSNNGLFVSLLVKENNSCKKIGVIHGDVLVDQMSKGKFIANSYCKLEKWLINRHCSCCIAVSESIRHILVGRGVDNNKLEVVYTGIELKKYDVLPDYYSDTLKICSIGYLRPVKNHMKLLEALNILKQEHPEVKVHCDIYGEGPEREKLKSYIDERNLKNITLKGYSNKVREVLNCYAVYVQPSQYESFGIAVLEAMNAGCCVIVNPVGGMIEIVKDDGGYLTDCNNPGKLAEQLYRCYTNRTELEEKAFSGRKKCEDNFSTTSMTQNITNLYKKCLVKKSEKNCSKEIEV